MSCSAAKASSLWRKGLQNALWALGGAPFEHRSDSLSAAFRNLAQEAREDHDPTLRRPVRPLRHDADAQQQGRRPRERLRRKLARPSQAAIKDALLMRASADFEDLPAYRRFVDEIVSRRNARNRPRIDSRTRAAENPAGPAHQRLRGGRRHTSPRRAASHCARCSTRSLRA